MEESRHLLGIELLIELSLAFPRLCHVEVFAAISLFSSRTLPIREEKSVECIVIFDLIEGIDGTLLKQSQTIGRLTAIVQPTIFGSVFYYLTPH